jgi:hypothetical protein
MRTNPVRRMRLHPSVSRGATARHTQPTQMTDASTDAVAAARASRRLGLCGVVQQQYQRALSRTFDAILGFERAHQALAVTQSSLNVRLSSNKALPRGMLPASSIGLCGKWTSPQDLAPDGAQACPAGAWSSGRYSAPPAPTGDRQETPDRRSGWKMSLRRF